MSRDARNSRLRFVLFALLSAVFIGPAGWTQDVLTERYNNARTGVTVEAMNSATLSQGWHRIADLKVDGRVYAQPLVVQGVHILRQEPARNLLLIATAHNHVYAFDADTQAKIWDLSLGQNDTTHMGAGCDFLSPDGIGIEATPVIDGSQLRLYVSYRLNPTENPDAARQEVVALDLRNGQIVAGPVEVQGAEFEPRWERSRASLLLQNGQVYVAFASRCEDPGMPIFHGFIFAFDAKSLTTSGEFEVTSGDTDGGGVWQASSGLVGDGTDIYFMSGNRRLEVGHEPQDEPNNADAFVRLHAAPVLNTTRVTFSVRDWFSPYRKLWLDAADLDLGSAGLVLLPGAKYLVGSGKQGWMYVLDSGNMGKIDPVKKWTPSDLQKLPLDATADQFPEDVSADRVVQKFQVGFQQYIPNPSYLAPPGASVAVATQTGNQLDVFNVGRDGAVYVTWQASSGVWSDGYNGDPYPARITPPITSPGAYVAAALQSSNQLDAFVAGNDGAVYVTWVVGSGIWTDGATGHGAPARITPLGVMPAGGCLTTAAQTTNQLDVFYVGNDGAVYVTWVVGLGHWSDGTAGNPSPARITPANFAAPGACVATEHQGTNQLNAFVVNKNDDAVWVTWVIGTGIWTDGVGNHGSPAPITPVQSADPAAGLVAAHQSPDQLDVFYPGGDGAVHVTWVVGLGHWTDGTPGNARPATLTPPNVTSPTGALSAALQTANQLDVFYLQAGGSFDNALMVTWVVGLGHWSDGTPGNSSPATITGANFTVPPGHSAASGALLGQLQVLFIGDFGAVTSTHVTGVGHWTDGRDNNPAPLRITRALWMYDWGQWPHVHGSPVFAQFPDGTARLYVWPEKDHLKSFGWADNHFDLQSKVLGTDGTGQLILDPDGMPGGMLAMAVDPTVPHGGVLFASLTQNGATDGPGVLRAFDPITLREVWNNLGDTVGERSYQFSKFVPPTIARGRVYLPTCSGEVLVYGKN